MKHPLSAREREVVEWMARGKTMSETALILGLARGTVRGHCGMAAWKLGTVNITHTCAKAAALGLVTLDSPTSNST